MKLRMKTHLQACLAAWLASSYYSYALRYNYTFELAQSAGLISAKHCSHRWNRITATFPSYLVSSYSYITAS